MNPKLVKVKEEDVFRWKTDQELHLKLQTLTNTMKLQQESSQTVDGPDR